jgi:hypothetical protein
MLAMRDHGTDDYTDLRDMDATDVGTLRDDDQACLDELGRYLVAADGWQRFGVWLLHKHFNPEAGEVFVERVDRTARRTQTSPARRSGFDTQELAATALRFDCAPDSEVGVIGMEFAGLGDFGSIAPLSAADEAVLAGLAERLRSHGKTDRFGVRLLRDAIAVEDTEVMMETCDREARTLLCDVAERSAASRTVETTWGWVPAVGDPERAVIQKCYFACEVWTDGTHSRTGC